MSLNIDASEWRLQTDGGIPYKLKEGGPTGSFGDDAVVNETYIIRASDFLAFLTESTSTIINWPNGIYGASLGRAYPGIAELLTTEVGFKPHDSNLPADPWGIDSDAPDGTYCQFLELSIKYSTIPGSDDDTEVFSVTADSTIQLLQVPSSNVAWITSEGEEESPRDPDQPASKLEPQTEWSISYPKFPWQHVGSILLTVRQCLGKVNSVAMPMLGNAAVGTILFTGLSIRRQLMATADGFQSSANLSLRMTEKNVQNLAGTVLGHNYFYRSEEGDYQKLLVDGNPVYQSYNLNALWAT